MNRFNRTILVLAVVGLPTALPAVLGIGPREAQAVRGRPLTPMSYAGVARRTTRRRVVATTAVVAGTAVAASAMIYSLPHGCIRTPMASTLYYHCANTWYRPYYQGSTVVYQTVAAP